MERTHRSVIVCQSPDDTEGVGFAMAQRIDGGACVAIVGGLGAGKTVFVRGACRGLGVEDDVLSPTFILYEPFEGRLPIVHLDLFRLDHEVEIEDLGVFDLLGGDTVVLAEWADRSETLMTEADIVVRIEGVGPAHPDQRHIALTYSSDFASRFGDVTQW